MTVVNLPHETLSKFVAAIFQAPGMSASDAATVAEVWANLRGVDSNGVARIPNYLTHALITNGNRFAHLAQRL
jgi:ureidoglycolate dehydrogenase (NAD+)